MVVVIKYQTDLHCTVLYHRSTSIMSDSATITCNEGESITQQLSQQLSIEPTTAASTTLVETSSNNVIDNVDGAVTDSAAATATNSSSVNGRINNSGRGSGGGRIPMGGRGIVGQAGRGGRINTYGRGRFHQQQPRFMPVKVHASSGVPFGHVPAYLPGSSSLVEELDQRVLIVLRDGKHIIGTLISFDQFGNLVLSNAMERQIVSALDKGNNNMKRNYYSDIPLDGLYIARGESLVLIGEVHDENNNPFMESVPLQKLHDISSSDDYDVLPKLEWDFDTDLTA